MSPHRSTPYDPDDAMAAARHWWRHHRGGRKLGFLVAAVIAAVLLLRSWYEVDTNAVGVVTTFGKITDTVQSGLHFRIPLVQQVHIVPVKKQKKMEFGFRTIASGVQSTYSRTEETLAESTMLTGDLNVAVVEWIVHYQITDPVQYLFGIRQAEDTLRDLSEATMREVVGDYSVTEVLTSGREEILEKTKARLAALCKEFETGISIQRVELKDSAPPEPVRPSFNEVNQAEQERDSKRNMAMAQYNAAIPKAQGEAQMHIEEAKGYAIERVNQAKGDVARFEALQQEYARAPEVTRTRLYLETMNEILSKVERKIFVDDQVDGIAPLLPLTPSGGFQ